MFHIWTGGVLDVRHIATNNYLLKPFLASSNPELLLHWPEYINSSNPNLNYHFVKTHVPGVQNRSFAVTRKGYMGLVPYDTQVGDEICVLYDCYAPIVVRRDGDYQLVVGNCFVYGLMDGEIAGEVEAGRLEVEEFHFK